MKTDYPQPGLIHKQIAEREWNELPFDQKDYLETLWETLKKEDKRKIELNEGKIYFLMQQI